MGDDDEMFDTVCFHVLMAPICYAVNIRPWHVLLRW